MKRITLGIAIAGCLLALSAAAQPTTAPPPPSAPEIPVLTVAGTGEARVAPDEATVRLGVLAQEPTARAAQDAVNRTANAILEAIRRLGVPANRIQTQDLSLNPVYAQGRPGEENQEPRIVGYQATNTVAVRLDKLEQVGPVIDAGLAAGANRLDGVVFGLRNDAAAQAEALTRAVEAATAKARTLARALRVRLVRVVDVAEGGIAVQPPPFLKGRFEADVANMSATPVSTGQVGVNASVTIRWEIAPE